VDEFENSNTVVYDTTNHMLYQDQNVKPYLLALGFATSYAEELAYEAKQEGLTRFKAGGIIHLLSNPEERNDKVVVYKSDSHQTWQLKSFPLPTISVQNKEAKTRIVAKGGIIKTNFLEAVWDNNMPHDLMGKIDQALQWSIDLHHLQIGDQFKVVYEEKIIEDNIVGTGKLLAIQFLTAQKSLMAYYLENASKKTFYDAEGRILENKFLKSPLKYGRISSPFNEKRFHPVDQIIKGHYGTDYAAPEGTPIRSVADGTIEVASSGVNNGNFIKIRHDNTYQTQYLHLQKFAEGIQNGTPVRQGQTIGYVGVTGKSTGPHVCFRFWKNGKQVDHLKEEIVNTDQPTNITIDQKEFLTVKDKMNSHLVGINLFTNEFN
jgi:murein DD-endopeptidase MepM/ murein hydrolase activator NlpD